MDETIRAYIERALELAGQADDELDESDLAEIARELGLTDADLERVEQAIIDHVDRGRGYAKHQMWDDAIREFEEASALAPSRSAIRLALADALLERWAATELRDDRQRAIEITRGVLSRDPKNEEAYALLARATPTVPATSAPDMMARRRLIAIGISLCVVMGFVVLGALIYGDNVNEVQQPHEPSSSLSGGESSALQHQQGEVDLPLKFKGVDGLALHVKRSRIARYPTRAFYTLWADIEVTGEIEVQRVDFRVKLLDDAGDVVKEHKSEVWKKHMATLRKGDRGRVALLFEADHAAASVRVETGVVEKLASKGPYAGARVIEPTWDVEAPSHLKLEVRERHAGFSTGSVPDRGTFKATWEIANVGTVPIRTLSYDINLYDRGGAKIESQRRIATFSARPPLEPGEVLLNSGVTIVPTTAYGRYEIAITEIQ